MSPITKKWLVVLEAKFGVDAEFSSHLVPFLDRFAAQEPTFEEWEQTLRAIAAAHRACDVKEEGLDEIDGLMGHFVTEMKKLDETLQVLKAQLDRVRTHMFHPDPQRILH